MLLNKGSNVYGVKTSGVNEDEDEDEDVRD